MGTAFATEDNRKTKLFEAWNGYLQRIHSQYPDGYFEDVYEGLANLLEFSNGHMGLRLLEDGRKLRSIPITREIQSESRLGDTLYIVVGRRKGKWLPLDVISIGSIVDEAKGEIHITFNPNVICDSASLMGEEGEA